MKGLETGKDKIQRICDAIRKETLEPAQQEAREIVENAHLQAAEIVKSAKDQASGIIQEAKKEIEEKTRVFQSSLQLACRQGIEKLKQNIEEKLLDQELAEIVTHQMSEPKVVAEILNSFFQIVEQKGIEDDFSVIIPKSLSAKQISVFLVAQTEKHLRHHALEVGDFGGGVKIRLQGRRITIDVSDAVVRELVATYIRRDFRDLVFSI